MRWGTFFLGRREPPASPRVGGRRFGRGGAADGLPDLGAHELAGLLSRTDPGGVDEKTAALGLLSLFLPTARGLGQDVGHHLDRRSSGDRSGPVMLEQLL